MLEKLARIRKLEQHVRDHSAARKEQFHRQGQLLPRERIARLLDRGSPFLELSTLAGLGMHDDDGDKGAMGGGHIVGIGVVSGKRCMVICNDSAIKGGTVPPMGVTKNRRAQEIALKNKLPIVNLIQSGGANLLYQSEVFVDGGQIFYNQARLSAAGIPQIAIVHGSSTAGGAYFPGLSDYVVLVSGKSKIFLAGPPLVQAAIGEDATDEELGGARVHATQTGLGEYLATDDVGAIATARDIVDKLRWEEAGSKTGEQPAYASEELAGVVPTKASVPYDVREVIARIVDRSDFLDFKSAFGPQTVCGHASIDGHQVGMIGNNGPITPDGSCKAGQFIQLCDQSGTPLIFLQNTTGYMVGTQAETGGAVKHGSKMIQAVANARVAKITIVLGGSYGAGNYGMCGRGFQPTFIFSWPTAQTAVMGAEQAARVMDIVARAKLEKAGRPIDEARLAAQFDRLRNQLSKESDVTFGTARLWDDGIIDPRDTRTILSLCLQICSEATTRELRPNTFGVGRL